jgi:hypothetical protein
MSWSLKDVKVKMGVVDDEIDNFCARDNWGVKVEVSSSLSC